VGGMGFDGPTSANLGAIYWNPAALGLVRGSQLMISATGHLAHVGVTRTPVDPFTGAVGAGQTTSARDFTHPFPSPVGPGSYLAISSDLGGDRFALGFATYMPFLEQVHFPLGAPGAHDEPTRYHALTIDLRNLALVPALAIRFGSDFRIGLAPGFLFSTGRMTFDEDTGLNQGTSFEDPAAAARYDISSGNSLGDAHFSVTLGGGIYYRRKSFEAGFSYQSRPLGSDVGAEVGGTAIVTAPPGAGGGPLTCGASPANRCVFGDFSYKLPDVWIGGVTWRLRPGLELTAMARWLWLHVHDRIDVRLVGPTLDASGLPQHIVLYRGFHDVWDARVRVSYWWHERVRVGAALRLETSAVDASAVNPAAVDGFKLEPIGLVEVRLAKKLWLGGGYGLTIMPSVDVTNSAFDPSAAVACAQANGDLASTGCRERLQGRARPSANGHYTYFAQDFGLTLTARF
jgi:long-subunit fatty acid transport protein